MSKEEQATIFLNWLSDFIDRQSHFHCTAYWPTDDDIVELKEEEALHYARAFINEGYYLRVEICLIEGSYSVAFTVWEYDEPEILRCSNPQICPTGAQVRQ